MTQAEPQTRPPSDLPSQDSESPPQSRGARVRERLWRWGEERAKRFALMRVPMLSERRRQVQREIEDIPRRMQRVTNQASLVLELVEDFRTGHYRKVPWHSLAVASGALLYAVSPADALPDALPLVGSIDDMLVIAVAMRVIRKDLRAYCEFKGYDVEAYF